MWSQIRVEKKKKGSSDEWKSNYISCYCCRYFNKIDGCRGKLNNLGQLVALIGWEEITIMFESRSVLIWETACILHHSIHPVILGDDSHRHYRDKSVPYDSPALSTATPAGIVKYPYPIWIRMEFSAGIYNRCTVSPRQHGMLSAPAGSKEKGRAGLHLLTDAQ